MHEQRGLWSTSAEAQAPAWLLTLLMFGVPVVVLIVIATPWFLRFWPTSRLEPEGSLVRGPAAARGLLVVASHGKGIGSAEAAIR